MTSAGPAQHAQQQLFQEGLRWVRRGRRPQARLRGRGKMPLRMPVKFRFHAGQAGRLAAALG